MQIIGFIGAMLILVAYVSLQFKRMSADSALYNVLNAVGSAILVYVALRPFQVGFVVLEGVWAIVSVVALVRGMTPSAKARASS
jgi:hypothetical protein